MMPRLQAFKIAIMKRNLLKRVSFARIGQKVDLEKRKPIVVIPLKVTTKK
jgi:hypothetical protein